MMVPFQMKESLRQRLAPCNRLRNEWSWKRDLRQDRAFCGRCSARQAGKSRHDRAGSAPRHMEMFLPWGDAWRSAR